MSGIQKASAVLNILSAVTEECIKAGKSTMIKTLDKEDAKAAVSEENENPVVAKAMVQCPYARKPAREVRVVSQFPSFNTRNGGMGLREIDTKLIPNTFGFCEKQKKVCKPVIAGGKWRGCNAFNRIDGFPSVTMMSYMICTMGCGMITLKTDGQEKTDDGSTEEESATDNYEKLLEWLKCMEIGNIYNINNPCYIVDNGTIVGIKIQDAQDKCITIGYGHAIQTEEEALKYGFDTWPEKTDKGIVSVINAQMKKYGAGIENPAILTLEEAEVLLVDDVNKAYEEVKKLCEAQGPYSYNQINALTSNVFNAGTDHANDADSLQYHLIRNDAENAMKVLHKAVDNGWYAGKAGLLRRRLMEYNICFNNDYTYYEDTELEALKKLTGFSKEEEEGE